MLVPFYQLETWDEVVRNMRDFQGGVVTNAKVIYTWLVKDD